MNTALLPSGRTGQAIAVLLLLLLVSAVWRLLAAPLVDLYEVRRLDLENRAMQAAHLKALADALPRLRASAGAASPSSAMTFAGPTDSVAAATLQGAVQDLVKGAGASLGSVEIVPPGATEGLHRIGLRVVLSGSSETVTRLLLAIAQAEPPMLVDDLQISGKAAGPDAAVLGRDAQSEPRLDAGFAIYAFRQDQAEIPQQ